MNYKSSEWFYQFLFEGKAVPIDAELKKYWWNTLEELFGITKFEDMIINYTPHHLHYDRTMRAIASDYAILFEKIMALIFQKCTEIYRPVTKYNKTVVICSAPGYTPFFRKIEELIQTGEQGENLRLRSSSTHRAHAYVPTICPEEMEWL